MARRTKVFGGVGAIALIAAALIGMMSGLGTFTFVYAEGHAYLSNDPTACTNCHVMQEYFDTWQKSGHHHVAVCNDCHLPHHNTIAKFWTKADNGFFHSLAFTLENYHEPIQIKARNREIVQNNCVACHSSMVDHLRPLEPGGEIAMCIHCHANVGHSQRSRARVWNFD